MLRDVVLLTDGGVSNPDEIIRTVASARDRMMVFSFGIGYGAGRHRYKGEGRAFPALAAPLRGGDSYTLYFRVEEA